MLLGAWENMDGWRDDEMMTMTGGREEEEKLHRGASSSTVDYLKTDQREPLLNPQPTLQHNKNSLPKMVVPPFLDPALPKMVVQPFLDPAAALPKMVVQPFLDPAETDS